MTRILMAAAVVAASVTGFAAQSPVPLTEEPHAKRLFYTAHLRLFEVNVAPGESTLDHVHDHDAVTVALGPATLRARPAGGEWGAPRSLAPGTITINDYTGATAVHRQENTGTTPFRAFVVENLRDKGWMMPRLISAPATTLPQQSRSFAVYEVRLSTSMPKTNHVHEQPTIVMLISGAVEVQGGGGESEFRMDSPGRWFPSQWEQPHTLTLMGSGDAHLVEVEAR